jgi:hypothetical protein
MGIAFETDILGFCGLVNGQIGAKNGLFVQILRNELLSGMMINS